MRTHYLSKILQNFVSPPELNDPQSIEHGASLTLRLRENRVERLRQVESRA